MWAHLQRQGIPVERRTVEKIMHANGWRGVTRAWRTPRTSAQDPRVTRAQDLVGRRWRAQVPNLLEVADFTHVAMVSGFGYTAFVWKRRRHGWIHPRRPRLIVERPQG